MVEHSILDMCCGSRMFWFNKQDTRAVFTDIRAEEHELCDGRRLVISPDLISDFRSLPFAEALVRAIYRSFVSRKKLQLNVRVSEQGVTNPATSMT